MLKSIIFLLVMISLLTTPTRAYEAYDINSLIVLQQQLKNKEQELTSPLMVKKDRLNTADICAKAATMAEKDYKIKKDLLHTIASVESGRWDSQKGRRVAWPWTVHANGIGHYYKSKAEAVAAVRALQQQGITNIDVGCMQINLRYHGKAFSSLEEAFDPEKNVAYSAEFLLSLHKRNGQNWQKTAMQYHSKNYTKGINYKNRLEKHYAEHINPNALQTLF